MRGVRCYHWVEPGVHPARAVGGLWLWKTLVPSGLRAVVVPSGCRATVQPHWWIVGGTLAVAVFGAMISHRASFLPGLRAAC